MWAHHTISLSTLSRSRRFERRVLETISETRALPQQLADTGEVRAPAPYHARLFP